MGPCLEDMTFPAPADGQERANGSVVLLPSAGRYTSLCRTIGLLGIPCIIRIMKARATSDICPALSSKNFLAKKGSEQSKYGALPCPVKAATASIPQPSKVKKGHIRDMLMAS
jgi:hypothetical protein